MDMRDFYRGRRVLVTGNTGFKGSWLCRILSLLGADVYGYSLEPPTDPNLYGILHSDDYVKTTIGDIADIQSLEGCYKSVRPDVVLHLAAQPLVRVGYRDPYTTYRTNVMGTVNILECVRRYGCKSFVNVTTDKVYENIEKDRLYKEEDDLDGFDPYSNSKSCSELVTRTYVRSFKDMPPISTARAGNVIGGGDFAEDRIIPDCIRAALAGRKVVLRNPDSIRPYQHVLEPLYSYLAIAWKQHESPSLAGSYNIGPDDADSVTTGQLADLFCREWGDGMAWTSEDSDGPHEANCLRLDNGKIERSLGIKPLWHIDDAVAKTVEWTKVWASAGDVSSVTDEQIREYLGGRGISVRG